MSEGLAEVMLLSSGYMSIERPSDRMELTSLKSAKHILQIGAVFINKPQIWVLNNYILAWNTCVQCRQAYLLQALHLGVDAVLLTYWEETKGNLGIRLQAFRSSSSHQRWKDDPILHGSLLLALSISRRFPLLFFLSLLSFCQSARLFTKCSFGSLGKKKSLLHIMINTDYCLLLIVTISPW